jgi:hypothetical protein
MHTCVHGALQRLIVPPGKRFTESILWNYQEESLQQIIMEAYDYSNEANQDEDRNPHLRYLDAQILGTQKVIPCPDIPDHATCMTTTSGGTLFL